MKLEEKITLLKQLYQISKVDGEIADTEFEFLIDLAHSLEVPFEVLDDIFDEKTIYLKNEVPKNIYERIIQIYRLALMIVIDNHIKFDEVNLLKNIAIELKLPTEPVTVMLSEIVNNKDKILEPEKLFDIFNVTNN